jgi:uncharacterized protein (TIGR02246 family)
MRSMFVSLLVITAPTVVQAQDPKSNLQALEDQFALAFNKGDYAGVASMYTENAVVLPSGAPMVKGRSEIRKLWGQAGEVLSGLKLTTTEVTTLSPEVLQEIGAFTAKSKDPSSPDEITGKFVVIWRKAAGDNWLIATDIWNEDE